MTNPGLREDTIGCATEKLVNDHRAGVAPEPSRIPSSNRLGQPSSVCLRTGLEHTISSKRNLMPTFSACPDEQIDCRIEDIGDS